MVLQEGKILREFKILLRYAKPYRWYLVLATLSMILVIVQL